MNLYEIMFILNPDMGEEEREKLLTRLKGTISKNKGEIIRFDDLGFKGFTYKIKKKSRGQYFLVYLDGPGAMVAEIERFLRIDENVIRFVVVKLDKHVTREDLEPKAEVEPETTPAAEQEDVGA
ncbi:MAG TPA: 30S ribosomal protein S6 [Deltaproteobacteria bacterium]|jgi:small subunit ribosomal protein S6|nr:30S ribosomal protein S6 [Deltaproteobacteria bacterium]OQC27595.1 MAG: 30S ribosomal protein S6 [Deltaproteobacteria bacterium ADurb.Bin072]HNQ85425.1 30S ribosomal protein S6 [Deltaproteobacteria bacterium]HNS89681.1 30S ribosomal protein S6 [Deltaproteobacteria bacterium]HOA44726.1 30S ribosomal protein S6 [Deltaproteobacteria bacterium]